ncbi:MAG: serine/threonine-protein kinase [Polyangiales bacterium]
MAVGTTTQIDLQTGSDLGARATSLRLVSTHEVHGCALLLGTRRLLANRYRLKRLLGRGASSVVYLAEDTVLDADVTLKVFVRNSRAASVRLEERIRPELRIARKVIHPNVSRVYDIGRAGDELFLTMEHAEGHTLREVLVAEKLASKRAHGFVLGVLDALVAIHAAGVVHRDLKPSNIIVRKDDSVVVIDFGLAADLAQGTSLGGVALGTPRYSAPEQMRGEEATRRSDVYSFGLVAREVYARAYPKGIPSRIATILDRATATDPEQRTPSAVELREELGRAIARRRVLSQSRRSVALLFSL